MFGYFVFKLILKYLIFHLRISSSPFNRLGLILGAFYWLHWVSQVPGGILARKYGTKLIFGVANLIGCWLCFLMPMASYFDYKILIFLRVIQGLITVRVQKTVYKLLRYYGKICFLGRRMASNAPHGRPMDSAERAL
jgi:MFS family permease